MHENIYDEYCHWVTAINILQQSSVHTCVKSISLKKREFYVIKVVFKKYSG